jgi:probable F420-dependent oxidoreductase
VVQIGIMYPSTELAPTVDSVRTFTHAVEAMGYDFISAGDHVLATSHDRERKMWGPYDERDAFHDPFVLSSYISALSPRLGLSIGVLVLPQRQTVIVARQAADLAILSQGRFRLGVGMGWSAIEFDALGQDFSSRGRRADEQLAMMRELWSGELVTFAGETETIDRARLMPWPPAPVPVWVGGASPAAYRRAATHADGFIFAEPVESAAVGAERVLERVRATRGDASGFGLELIMIPDMPTPRTSRWPRDRPSHLPKTADVARRWRELGGTHLTVFSTWMGLHGGGLDAHLEYAEAALARARTN